MYTYEVYSSIPPSKYIMYIYYIYEWQRLHTPFPRQRTPPSPPFTGTAPPTTPPTPVLGIGTGTPDTAWSYK